MLGRTDPKTNDWCLYNRKKREMQTHRYQGKTHVTEAEIGRIELQ